MALSSGVYIIENVHNRNWAILTNDNDGDDVLSGTDVDSNEGHKVERQLIFYRMPVNELLFLFSGRSRSSTMEHIFFGINISATMRATRSQIISVTNPQFSASERVIPSVGTSTASMEFTGTPSCTFS
jgi:hypothetical protein